MAAHEDVLASIRRLPLAERLQVIRLAAEEAAADTPVPAAVAVAGTPHRPLSVDELLAARLTPPPGVGAVSLDDMERAIAQGASGLAGV